MSELGAKWISCDHTFKSVCNIGYVRENDRQWINQYNSIFCVLNEKGEIINWQFTATESFDEIKDMFLELAKNKKTEGIQIVCIDNSCKWRHLLQAIFPGASIKQDLFYAVQRFCKTLKKKIHCIANLPPIMERFSAIQKTKGTRGKWRLQQKIS